MRLVSIAPLVLGCCVLLLSSLTALAQEEEIIKIDCASLVTRENRDLGFSAVEHSSCLQGDESECFAHTCRLCKQEENNSTKYYKACDALLTKTSQSPSSQIKESSAPVMMEAAYTSASASLTNDQCASRVATGDRNVGISAVYDSTCANGGLGCFGTERCKYCRLSNTLQSQGFKTCSELTEGTSSTNTPTTFMTSSTTTASTTTQSGCAVAVSKSGLQGVSFVTETLCQTNARLTGCVVASACRLCRSTKNEGNQFLVSCKVLGDQQLITSSATVTTVASTADGDNGRGTTEENAELSAGPMVGIGAVAGFALMVAVIAIKSSRARRVADVSVHTPSHQPPQLQRADSILHVVGRDLIAQL